MLGSGNKEFKKLPFYKNTWFWVVVFIFIITSAAGANFKSNDNMQVGELNQSTQRETEEIKSDQPQQNSELGSTEKKDDPRESEAFKKALAEGKIFEADPDQYYSRQMPVLLKKKDFVVSVEDFTAGYDVTNLSAPCQLKVIVTLDNPTDKEMYWSCNSFKAMDSQGFTYSPNIYGVRGDLSGTVPPIKLRRCQLVFDIPPVRQNFILTYADPDTDEKVNFKLDISARENERYDEQIAAEKKRREENKEEYAKREEEQRQLELQRQKDEEEQRKNEALAEQYMKQQQLEQERKAQEYLDGIEDIADDVYN